MSVPLPLERLRTELSRRRGTVYLLTVSDGGRPHCVAARVHWDGNELEVRTGSSSARNAEARPGVTLLVAPDGPAAGAEGDTGGYSLIVDGDATAITTAPEGGGIVRLRPTHAVFHRPAEDASGASVHDCVHVFDQGQEAGA